MTTQDTTAQDAIRKQLLDLADRLGIDEQEAGEAEWAAYLSDQELAAAIVLMRPEAGEQVERLAQQ